jgi:ABC-type transport system involved in multi-copper enzyme maturation permease subunit
MLWYKTWIETRKRFLVSLAGITLISAYQVFHADSLAEPDSALNYYYFVLHSTQQMLSVMWILAITLLNMDGLLHEKNAGTAPLTLTLPVSRHQLMKERVSLVFGEALLLALLPSLAMLVTGSVCGKTHSLYQATFHFLMLIGGGIVFFAIAVLCSSLIEGQYLAPMSSLGLSTALLVLANGQHSSYFSPFMCMLAQAPYDRKTSLLVGPIPWMRLAMFVTASIALIVLAFKLLRHRDF